MGFHPDHYDHNGNFISQHRLHSPLDDLAGYDPLSNNDPKPRHRQKDSLYPNHDRRRNRPLDHSNKSWSSHSHFGALSPPDSPAASPYLSYLGEPWSPASVSPELDDDYSLASSTTSLSPNSDLDTFPCEQPEDEIDDNFFSSPEVSPGADSIYQPLEQYPLHAPHERNGYLNDDDLSPLTFSPPSLPLNLLSLSESAHQPSIKNTSTYSPPFQPYNYGSFNYDSSTSAVPCSPSRRRSTTLPELEPTTFNADLFGLHKSIPTEESPDIVMDMPVSRWCSFPGCETDDDLIPMELASKNYIPDASATVPTTSTTGSRSLLLWDHDLNDRSDMPTSLSPPPENFYLDPTILAECGDEELQQVYELRQRTAKSEKWERERCRELSALLRLKLDERGVLGSGEGGGGGFGGGGGGDFSSHHQSGSPSLSCCSDLPFSSSPSSNSLTVYQPQPSSSSSSSTPSTPSSSTSTSSPVSSSTQNSLLFPTPSSSPSSSSTLPSTLEFPHAQSQQQGPKHKIRSMAQLVASMLFHRQSDALRRHPSRKATAGGHDSSTTTTTTSSFSSYPPHLSSTMGDTGMKMLSTRKSRLSMVTLPEELEVDSEEEKEGVGMEVETGDDEEAQQEEEDEVEDMDLDDGLLGRSCLDMDLDREGQLGDTSSHNRDFSGFALK